MRDQEDRGVVGPGSGFTLLSEALTMALVKEMPVAAVAKLIGEHGSRGGKVVPPRVLTSAKSRADSDKGTS